MSDKKRQKKSGERAEKKNRRRRASEGLQPRNQANDRSTRRADGK
jgi:hypothetical protein